MTQVSETEQPFEGRPSALELIMIHLLRGCSLLGNGRKGVDARELRTG